MKIPLWIAVALLALGLGACQPDTSAPDAAEDDGSAAEQADPALGESYDSETGEGEADGQEGEAPAADEAEDADAAGAPEEGGGEEAALPTPDPTIVALAESFQPPVRGNPDAPIVLYEFSDYL